MSENDDILSQNRAVDSRRIDPETGEPRSVFRIPQENWAEFEKKVEKLSKRAERYLGHKLRAVPFSYEMVEDGKGRARKVLEVLFTCDFKVKAEGWTFAARIDHSNEAGNIIRSVPNTGFDVPERYRDGGPVCDHCGVKRLRRDTFLLRCDATGEIKQVGKTCLNDFMGHDVMKIALAAEILGLAGEAARGCETWGGGLNDYRWVDVEEFLTHCAWAVRTYGWVSASEARAREDRGERGVETTRSRAGINLSRLHRPHQHDEPGVEPSDEDRAFAEQAREWARTFGQKEARSDWEHAAYVVAEAEYIEPRNEGIAASIVGVHAKNVSKQAQGTALRDRLANSKHVGSDGQRLTFEGVLVIGVRSFDTDFGVTVIHRFLTADGNLLVWFSTRTQGIREGETIRLRGTVKKHDTRDGVNQTVLTRCNIEQFPVT